MTPESFDDVADDVIRRYEMIPAHLRYTIERSWWPLKDPDVTTAPQVAEPATTNPHLTPCAYMHLDG